MRSRKLASSTSSNESRDSSISASSIQLSRAGSHIPCRQSSRSVYPVTSPRQSPASLLEPPQLTNKLRSTSYTLIPGTPSPRQSPQSNTFQYPTVIRKYPSVSTDHLHHTPRVSPTVSQSTKRLSSTSQRDLATSKLHLSSSRHHLKPPGYLTPDPIKIDKSKIVTPRPRSLDAETSLNLALVELIKRSTAGSKEGGSRVGSKSKTGSLETQVISLLAAGASPNTRDVMGRPLIMMVLDGGANPSILKLLLDAGASPDLTATVESNRESLDITDYCFEGRKSGGGVARQTALHCAAKRGLHACVSLLLSAGADVNQTDSRSETALMKACKAGHASTSKALLDHGASVFIQNIVGRTALHLAAMKDGNVECVRALLDYEAQLDVIDNSGKTALFHAAEGHRADIVEAMLLHESCNDLGWTVDCRDPDSYKTALHCSVEGASERAVSRLLEHGADINSKDASGRSSFFIALSRAARKGGSSSLSQNEMASEEVQQKKLREIIVQLIESGCDVWGVDRNLNTTLHAGARCGMTDVVDVVVSAGTESAWSTHLVDVINIKGHGGITALMLAAFGGHAHTVCALLNYGANPDLVDRHHASALVYALIAPTTHGAQDNFINIIGYLFRYNCNPDLGVSLFSLITNRKDNDIICENATLDKILPYIEPGRLYSPLEVAFLCGKSHLFLMLMRLGCNLWQFDLDQWLDYEQNYKNNIRSDDNNNNRSINGSHGDDNPRPLIDEKTASYLLSCVQSERRTVMSLTQLSRRPALSFILQHMSLSDVSNLNISQDVKQILFMAATPSRSSSQQSGRKLRDSLQQKEAKQGTLPVSNFKTSSTNRRATAGRQLPAPTISPSSNFDRRSLVRLSAPSRLQRAASMRLSPKTDSDLPLRVQKSRTVIRQSPKLGVSSPAAAYKSRQELNKVKPRFTESVLAMGT